MNGSEEEAYHDLLDAEERERRRELERTFRDGPDPGQEPNQPLACWEESGVWCAVLEGPAGALCGYARLPDGHPWIGLHRDDEIPEPEGIDTEQPAEQAIDDYGAIPVFVAALGGEEGFESFERTLAGAVAVHGGITWCGPMPIAGAPHGWWIGFDCGHAQDGIDPERYRRMHPWAPESLLAVITEGHIWTEEEVAMEIKRMVPVILQAMS